MLNSFDGKFSVFFGKIGPAKMLRVLFKKLIAGVLIAVIFAPCFVEAVQAAAGQDVSEFGDSTEVLLKCRLENIGRVGCVGGVAQDCKLSMECFAQPLTGIKEPLFFNQVNGTEVSSGNTNNAANNGTSKSGDGTIHFLEFLFYAIGGGLLVTVIGNLLIWLRWR